MNDALIMHVTLGYHERVDAYDSMLATLGQAALKAVHKMDKPTR